MTPRYFSTPVTPFSPEDRRAIVNGIAIGAGVAVITEIARFGLAQAQAWIDRRREAARGMVRP